MEEGGHPQYRRAWGGGAVIGQWGKSVIQVKEGGGGGGVTRCIERRREGKGRGVSGQWWKAVTRSAGGVGRAGGGVGGGGG